MACVLKSTERSSCFHHRHCALLAASPAAFIVFFAAYWIEAITQKLIHEATMPFCNLLQPAVVVVYRNKLHPYMKTKAAQLHPAHMSVPGVMLLCLNHATSMQTKIAATAHATLYAAQERWHVPEGVLLTLNTLGREQQFLPQNWHLWHNFKHWKKDLRSTCMHPHKL